MSENTEDIPSCSKCGNLIKGDSRIFEGDIYHLNCLPAEEKRKLMRADQRFKTLVKIFGYSLAVVFIILIVSVFPRDTDTLNPFGNDGFICKYLVPSQDTDLLRNVFEKFAGGCN